MITETKVRYEVRWEDEKGRKWYRGKESGLYEYDDAKLLAINLYDNNMRNIRITEVTEIYKDIENI